MSEQWAQTVAAQNLVWHLLLKQGLVSIVWQPGFNQLWQLRPLIQSLSTEATKMLVQAFVLLHLDYCNSLLYHRPTNATGAVCAERGCTFGDWCSSKRPHHTSVASAALSRSSGWSSSLWLAKPWSPGLPCWQVSPGVTSDGHQLRSANILICEVPQTQNCFHDRSFSVASPCLWNALPSMLRQTDASFDCFKRLLKTHLFSQCH